jgi:type IV pilus assembly protein PilW
MNTDRTTRKASGWHSRLSIGVDRRLSAVNHVRLRAAGFSIVELMVSLTIGLMLLTTLIGVFTTASAARGELERTSRQTENGRYAVELLSDDLRVAGYYGEVNVGALPLPAALPDPCSTNPAEWAGAMPLHVQGYDAGVPAPACLPASARPNTDVVVVRRARTCAAGSPACEPLTAGRPYLQASLCSTEMTSYVVGLMGAAAFPLTRKDCATLSALREYVVHVYFLGTETRAGRTIPLLKRLELTGPSLIEVSLVEGIEEINIEYGVDRDGNGQPDAYTADPTSYTYPGCTTCTPTNNWANVVTAQLYVLARATDPSPSHTDTKTYTLGRNAAGDAYTVGPMNDGYRRHVYTALVRIVNPAGRKEAP